jgi:hypothetical protein
MNSLQFIVLYINSLNYITQESCCYSDYLISAVLIMNACPYCC